MEYLTKLIAAARLGDKASETLLFESVYTDLRRIAQRHLAKSGQGSGHATSLVHEVYLRIARAEGLAVNDRAHFFAVASRAMRQIVIDHVRSRQTDKRGGGVEALSLDSAIVAVAEGRDDELLVLDEALHQLAALDPRLAQVVELRFYGGLELDELAEVIGVSSRTVRRDWRKARAFLYHQITGEQPTDD